MFTHGTTPKGRVARAFRLSLTDGSSVTISEYGCSMLSLQMPDESGEIGETILGFPWLPGYLRDTNYLGALIGRYANRIAHGRFSLDGETYVLSNNEGGHHLHGGRRGFSHHLWQGEIIELDGCPALQFERVSPDGEEGYPGELSCRVVFSLSPDHEVDVTISCETSAPTVVNLTLHPYFNLDEPGTSAMDHRVRIHASEFLPVDNGMIPIGERLPVAETPFDFRTLRTLGERIGEDHPQLAIGKGYDHTFPLEDADGTLREAAVVQAARSGRWLRIFTTAPGIQLYSGNHLGESVNGHDIVHPYRSGLCLEPQAWPDSPNQPDFPDTTLRPGEEYVHRIRYSFGTGELD